MLLKTFVLRDSSALQERMIDPALTSPLILSQLQVNVPSDIRALLEVLLLEIVPPVLFKR